MTKLIFKDGTTLTGKILSEALFVILFRVENYHYLVNKLELAEEGIVKIEDERS